MRAALAGFAAAALFLAALTLANHLAWARHCNELAEHAANNAYLLSYYHCPGGH